MTGEQRKFELSVPQIVGSALAAVTAAVAASYMGVAGTVIGAAVVSVASTVATAVYTHYLKRTGDRVKQHTISAWREPGQEGEEQGLLAAAVHATPPADTGPGDSGGDTLVMPVVVPARRGRVPWVRVGVAAALVFAVSMGGILAYQAVAQQTLHEQITGKSPVKKQPGHAPVKDRDQGRDDDRTTGRPASPSPSPTVTPRTPTSSATPDPSVTPSATPTPEESVEPSPETTPGPDEGRPDPGEQASSAPPATEQPQPDEAQDLP
ncbi:MAG: hypothetical protein HOW71_46210 [Nonomuraea sp.]|nr:hypothetical protein [Nonomuraea sp.]